jgi:hypothetical protein
VWTPEPVLTLLSKEKSLVPTENQTPTVQPVARRYTDPAIPILGFKISINKNNYARI